MLRKLTRTAVKPRKMPTQARSARTVETILEGAARVLEREGLEGFNTNLVAEHAGVSIGSLYQYFPKKEALVAALIAHQASALRAAVLEAIDHAQGLPLPQAVRLITRAVVVQHAKHPVLERALEYEEQRLPVSEEQQALVADTHAHLRGLLRRYRRELAVRDLHDATTTVQIIMRALVDSALEREPFDPHAVEETVTRAVLSYLCFRAKEG